MRIMHFMRIMRFHFGSPGNFVFLAKAEQSEIKVISNIKSLKTMKVKSVCPVLLPSICCHHPIKIHFRPGLRWRITTIAGRFERVPFSATKINTTK